MFKNKIPIYVDEGANIKFLLKSNECKDQFIFYTFPYDSKNRLKNKTIFAAIPSAFKWKYALKSKLTWQDIKQPWSDFQPSEKYEEIAKLIDKNSIEDIGHIDSANKSKCSIFLTGDKDDIWLKRKELEGITGIKTFCPNNNAKEQEACINYIKKLLQKKIDN